MYSKGQSELMYEFAKRTVEQALNRVDRNDLPWMQTYSGVMYRHMSPKPEDINLEDIAQGLSQICRFAGQIRTFYSVAEHVVRCSYHAPEWCQYDALHHDDSEAYLVDLPRPIKRAPGMEIYRYYEELTTKAIQERFGLGEEPEAVKYVDNRMLITEARDLFNKEKPCTWISEWGVEPYDEIIVPWSPEEARRKYLMRHEELRPKSRAKIIS